MHNEKPTNAVYEYIVRVLSEHGVKYDAYDHEPVRTSEEAARIRNTNQHEGQKHLYLMWIKSWCCLCYREIVALM